MERRALIRHRREGLAASLFVLGLIAAAALLLVSA